ncbi:(2E,6E)-farnesyl diphosphate synthase [Orbus sturtevantii]|uniref:(2E,6E)-farnesyl diphosphate synthase n=1 Tax=Orbus sturtevantii TaxID=3074109 RepID=UPI00370D932C
MDNSFIVLHEQYSQRINRLLTEYLANIDSSLLKEAMEYSLLAEGKRIRPFLVYATGQMFDCVLEKLDAPAAAIEAIHSYSLIHDDLPAMDNDELRRGRPTCHIKYGEATAILAGDALQSYGYSLIANIPNLSDNTKILMLKELSFASGVSGMCLGQSLDLQAEEKVITLDELELIHVHKTGALIKTAIRLGMFAAGDKAMQYQRELDNYAYCIGLAFQIQDDILDVIGNKNVMGKNQGVDKQLAKSTYTSLIGLENSIQACQRLYKQAIEALDKIPYNSHALTQLADFIITRNS